MKTRAFTLIELLVVVLIIGILAAIAVPQYQKAVMKSRLAQMKITANDIKKAVEAYYLSTGKLPTDFSELDFSTLGEPAENVWGEPGIITSGGYFCALVSDYNQTYCMLDNKLMYLMNYSTSSKANVVSCRTWTLDKSDIYNKVCQSDTGKTASEASCVKSVGYCNYYY